MRCRARAGLVALLALWLSTAACGSSSADEITVPTTDSTPPTAAALQADIPNRSLATVWIGSPAVSAEMGENDTVRVFARGDDNDGGVKDVRIWASTTLFRLDGSKVGPSLAGQPMASNPSTAVPGQKAKKTGSVTWTFSVPSLLGSFERLELEIFGEVVNFHGGSAKTSTLKLQFQRKSLRLHVVALTDSNGGHAFSATPTDFAALIGRVNRVFSGTGIRFLFDPAKDWQVTADTDLNQEQGFFRIAAAAIATVHSKRIVLFLRWGPDPANRTGNGNAFPPPGANPKPVDVTDDDQRYVMLPSLLDSSFFFLNLGNGSFVAHELGHYLGLYHTFPGWNDVFGPVFNGTVPGTQADVDQKVVDYIVARGGTIDALDGDLLGSTPPDPGPVLYKAHANQDICSNRDIMVTGTSGGSPMSFTFSPDPSNVMSYYASCVPSGTQPAPQTFTFEQIQQMHKTLGHPFRKQLWP